MKFEPKRLFSTFLIVTSLLALVFPLLVFIRPVNAFGDEGKINVIIKSFGALPDKYGYPSINPDGTYYPGDRFKVEYGVYTKPGVTFLGVQAEYNSGAFSLSGDWGSRLGLGNFDIKRTASPGTYTIKINAWGEEQIDMGSQPGGSIVVPFGGATVNATYRTECRLQISINNSTMGTTDPSPGDYWYSYGASVSVTASEYDGYALEKWVLDGTNESTNPISVSMTEAHSLQAVFNVNTTVTFSAEGLLENGGGDALIVDGKHYSANELPVKFFWAVDSEHSFVWNLLYNENLSWNSGSGLSNARSGELTVPEEGGTVTAHYSASGAESPSDGYDVTFQVVDFENYAISGINVTFADQNKMTDASGQCVFHVDAGTYTASVPQYVLNGYWVGFLKWDDGSTLTSRSVVVSAAKTITAIYKTKMYVSWSAVKWVEWLINQHYKWWGNIYSIHGTPMQLNNLVVIECKVQPAIGSPWYETIQTSTGSDGSFSYEKVITGGVAIVLSNVYADAPYGYEPTWTMQVEIIPNEIAVPYGDTAIAVVKVTPQRLTKVNITLETFGLPSDCSRDLSPQSSEGSREQPFESTLTIYADESAHYGIYTLRVGAVANGYYYENSTELTVRGKEIMNSLAKVTFFAFGLDSTANTPVITVGETKYYYNSFPLSFNFNVSTTHTYMWENVVNTAVGKRFILDHVVLTYYCLDVETLTVQVVAYEPQLEFQLVYEVTSAPENNSFQKPCSVIVKYLGNGPQHKLDQRCIIETLDWNACAAKVMAQNTSIKEPDMQDPTKEHVAFLTAGINLTEIWMYDPSYYWSGKLSFMGQTAVKVDGQALSLSSLPTWYEWERNSNHTYEWTEKLQLFNQYGSPINWMWFEWYGTGGMAQTSPQPWPYQHVDPNDPTSPWIIDPNAEPNPNKEGQPKRNDTFIVVAGGNRIQGQYALCKDMRQITREAGKDANTALKNDTFLPIYLNNVTQYAKLHLKWDFDVAGKAIEENFTSISTNMLFYTDMVGPPGRTFLFNSTFDNPLTYGRKDLRIEAVKYDPNPPPESWVDIKYTLPVRFWQNDSSSNVERNGVSPWLFDNDGADEGCDYLYLQANTLDIYDGNYTFEQIEEQFAEVNVDAWLIVVARLKRDAGSLPVHMDPQFYVSVDDGQWSNVGQIMFDSTGWKIGALSLWMCKDNLTAINSIRMRFGWPAIQGMTDGGGLEITYAYIYVEGRARPKTVNWIPDNGVYLNATFGPLEGNITEEDYLKEMFKAETNDTTALEMAFEDITIQNKIQVFTGQAYIHDVLNRTCFSFNNATIYATKADQTVRATANLTIPFGAPEPYYIHVNLDPNSPLQIGFDKEEIDKNIFIAEFPPQLGGVTYLDVYYVTDAPQDVAPENMRLDQLEYFFAYRWNMSLHDYPEGGTFGYSGNFSLFVPKYRYGIFLKQYNCSLIVVKVGNVWGMEFTKIIKVGPYIRTEWDIIYENIPVLVYYFILWALILLPWLRTFIKGEIFETGEGLRVLYKITLMLLIDSMVILFSELPLAWIVPVPFSELPMEIQVLAHFFTSMGALMYPVSAICWGIISILDAQPGPPEHEVNAPERMVMYWFTIMVLQSLFYLNLGTITSLLASLAPVGLMPVFTAMISYVSVIGYVFGSALILLLLYYALRFITEYSQKIGEH